MALGRAFSVAVRGLDGDIVEIEADITSGLPGVHLVGLADVALQESRDRVRAAVTNCGNSWPMARLTLALSPATLPKMGSVYDIALAAAVLSAQRKRPWHRLEKTVLLGELSLDGRVRPVRGVLPAVLAAKRDGWPAVVVPQDCRVCTWWVCLTPHCRSPVTGSGRRSPIVETAGRWPGSRLRCRRRRCRKWDRSTTLL